MVIDRIFLSLIHGFGPNEYPHLRRGIWQNRIPKTSLGKDWGGGPRILVHLYLSKRGFLKEIDTPLRCLEIQVPKYATIHLERSFGGEILI